MAHLPATSEHALSTGAGQEADMSEQVKKLEARLLEIAEKCPVHRTLTSEIAIRTRLLGRNCEVRER
jgi:uncharacterized OsmC-like protein